MLGEVPTSEEGRLADEAVVVRFGGMNLIAMAESVEDEFEDSGIYGLSVFCTAGLDADATARAAGLPHPNFFCSTVGAIRAIGREVVADRGSETGHAIVVFPEMPTTADWDRLRSVFQGPFPNPMA